MNGISVDEVIDALCQFDIGISHATGIVGSEFQQYTRVTDVDFRVMLSFLYDFRYSVDKVDSVIELLKFHHADDGFFFVFPFWAFFQCGLQFVFF